MELATCVDFGGVTALTGHEIDILITPDPIETPDILYLPVFDYELLLAVPTGHPMAAKDHATFAISRRRSCCYSWSRSIAVSEVARTG